MTPQDRKHRGKRRRAAIRHAVFTRAPARLLGKRLAMGRPGEHFCVNNRTIELPNLPDELCGLKITHFSDPHIGELITADHLPPMVETANSLGGDLIAVTGDFIDFSNKYLPAVVESMRRLEAPLGVWFVLGNHDYLDNAEEVKRAFHAAGLNLLVNEAVKLRHQERTIAVGGIDWADKPAVLSKLVRGTADLMDKSDLSIMLAHHPHAFDACRECGINLTLSGHTHGGQIMLGKSDGRLGKLGLGQFSVRYLRGLYAQGDCRLFVSSGIGSWFPFRIQCPAEITLLELQNTY